MKNTNPWTFGIILIFGFVIFVWYDFETPFSPLTQTEEIEGKISNIKIAPVEGGHGFLQKITYYYFIGNKKYTDTKKIGRKYSNQYIGNRVLIEYSIKKPQKNKIVHFIGDYTETKKEAYFSYTENGYHQIELINGFFYYTEFANKGKIASTLEGEIYINNDTLSFIPFDRKIDQKKLLFAYSENEKKELIDLTTNLIYR